MRFFPVVLLIGVLTVPGAVAAMEAGEEIDDDHLFAFAEGTDIGEAGDTELENGSFFRFGKKSGDYFAFQQVETPAVVVATSRLKLLGSAAWDDWQIDDVPGFDDRSTFAFGELSGTVRYQLMNRDKSGIGFDLQVEPSWSPREDGSGEKVTSYAAPVAALVDYEFVKGKVIGILNAEYEPEWTRSQGEWEKESGLNFSEAVMALWPSHVFGLMFFYGVGTQQLTSFEGLGLDSLVGWATFVGPQFCFHNHEGTFWLIGGWGFQVGGHANNADGLSTSNLNLVDFERNRATVRFGFSF